MSAINYETKKLYWAKYLLQAVMYESRIIKHLYLTSSRFEILSWLRVFISYIPIATVLIKNCQSCCLFRTLYFLRSGLQGVKVIVFPFWRKNLNLNKTWRLIQCIGKLLKPEEFPDKMNFKKYVIGHVLRKFSKPIDKWRAFLLSSYNCLPF